MLRLHPPRVCKHSQTRHSNTQRKFRTVYGTVWQVDACMNGSFNKRTRQGGSGRVGHQVRGQTLRREGLPEYH
eukprot:5926295-Prymnesium_polylepis.1